MLRNTAKDILLFNKQNENKATSLQNKLQTALKYISNTCVLGASNKFEDICRTNGFVRFNKFRYSYSGDYIPVDYQSLTPTDKQINTQFDAKTKKYIFRPTQQWFYSPEKIDTELLVIHYFCNSDLDPFDDPKFNLSSAQKKLLLDAMFTLEVRYGTCSARSNLIAKYLWENNQNIHRIEVVRATSFDHVFVIVNREGNLADSTTWGKAWVIDAWPYNKGTIFPAAKFKTKMNEIKQYAQNEMDALTKINIGSDIKPDWTKEVGCKLIVEINPEKDLYPTYQRSPLVPIESYYTILNSYPKEIQDRLINGLFKLDKQLHEIYFRDSLNEIKKSFSHKQK